MSDDQNLANEAQQRLNNLRKSRLERDDSGPFRVYRNDTGDIFHSVTHILKNTAPAHQQEALERWLARPGSYEERDMAAKRGTLAHNHAEYILKTAHKLARATATKRGSLKTREDGLERPPSPINRWALEKAIQAAPRPGWSAAGYARGLRTWIEDNCTAVHSIEFSINHTLGFAGTCDALIDVKGKGPYIVDWKTSVRERSEDLLTNYIDQLGAYSLGLKSLTGIQATGAFVVVARRTGAPQVRELTQLELFGAEARFTQRIDTYWNEIYPKLIEDLEKESHPA
ncbi:MAG: PD-(D/E)XK nuclease family protein [Opitutae bacterium]